MAPQGSEYYRQCLGEAHPYGCFGLVHPLDPHMNCFKCRPACGPDEQCYECSEWDDQTWYDYFHFLDVAPGVLNHVRNFASVPVENGNASAAVESLVGDDGHADPHPSVYIAQGSPSLEPHGSDVAEQVVLTVSNLNGREPSTAQTPKPSLGSRDCSYMTESDVDSAASLHSTDAGEVLNGSRDLHDRSSSRLQSFSETSQVSGPPESPPHGACPSPTKAGPTMLIGGSRFPHPGLLTGTRVPGSEVAAQPSMRLQGSPPPSGTPKQEGASPTRRGPAALSKAAPAEGPDGFPKLTPISITKRAPKTRPPIPAELLNKFPVIAPLNPRGNTQDPRPCNQPPVDRHQAATNGYFNRTVSSLLHGIRAAPHPSSGRWEKKDAASRKKGAALPRDAPSSAPTASGGASSAATSTAGSSSSGGHPRSRSTTPSVSSSSRVPRSGGVPPHYSVRRDEAPTGPGRVGGGFLVIPTALGPGGTQLTLEECRCPRDLFLLIVLTITNQLMALLTATLLRRSPVQVACNVHQACSWPR